MTPICIAGMHRAGTSAIAQLLHRCGVYLGDPSALGAMAPNNPDEFWEDARFVAINDAILGAFDGAWDCPPLLIHGWPDDERLRSVRRDAEALLADCAVQQTPWGWKDARTSLTFPFWQRYFPDMKVVFCLRDPLAVAHALFARSHHSYIFGLNMWYHYTEAFVDAVPPTQRIVTAYDDASGDNTPAELARILTFLDLSVPIAAQERILSALPAGHHHLPDVAPPLYEAGVGAAITDLYGRLCEEAGLAAMPKEGSSKRIAARVGQHSPKSGAPAYPATALAQGGDGRIDHTAIEATRLRCEIGDMRTRFSTLEATYRTLKHDHHDLEQQLSNLRIEHRDLVTYCGKLAQELADRDDAQHAIDRYIQTLHEHLAALDDEHAHTARYVQTLMHQLHDVQDDHERTGGYVRTLEEQVVASERERGRVRDYVQSLEAQIAALKDEQMRASDYARMLEGRITGAPPLDIGEVDQSALV